MVPVLLLPDMLVAIKVLLDTRNKYISDENPYLFAISGKDRSTTGWIALKKVVKLVPDLEHPENLTSTKMRKYLATMSKVSVFLVS